MNTKAASGEWSPADFVAWRNRLGWSQAAAAAALGLSRRWVQAYEAGEMEGRPAPVPRTVRLACQGLEGARQPAGGPLPADLVEQIAAATGLDDRRRALLSRFAAVLDLAGDGPTFERIERSLAILSDLVGAK